MALFLSEGLVVSERWGVSPSKHELVSGVATGYALPIMIAAVYRFFVAQVA